jgi:hypothetical protein
VLEYEQERALFASQRAGDDLLPKVDLDNGTLAYS